jgi:hypothetical protein
LLKARYFLPESLSVEFGSRFLIIGKKLLSDTKPWTFLLL